MSAGGDAGSVALSHKKENMPHYILRTLDSGGPQTAIAVADLDQHLLVLARCGIEGGEHVGMHVDVLVERWDVHKEKPPTPINAYNRGRNKVICQIGDIRRSWSTGVGALAGAPIRASVVCGIAWVTPLTGVVMWTWLVGRDRFVAHALDLSSA